MNADIVKNEYRLQVSSSVIPFREKAEKIWGLQRYEWSRDIFKPCIFFGMYHIGDYYHYLRHLGKKTIFWCGYDILQLKTGRIFGRKTEHYVESELERDELAEFGIKAVVRPSFLEDIDDFPVCFKPTDKPQVFLSTRSGRDKEYGVKLVAMIAPKLPEITFHIYGTKLVDVGNIVFHGIVPPEQFNGEIKNYHCGLRTNEHDGFSEITAKSILMGQYPITRIKYPHIWNYESEDDLVRQLKRLKKMTEPNLTPRAWWRISVNKYPWTK